MCALPLMQQAEARARGVQSLIEIAPMINVQREVQ